MQWFFLDAVQSSTIENSLLGKMWPESAVTPPGAISPL